MLSQSEKNDTTKGTRNHKFFNGNFGDLQRECLSHMTSNGIPFFGQLITDGEIHRFSIDKKLNEPDEWYKAFSGMSNNGNSYLYCMYGSWSEGSKFEFKSWINTSIEDERERQEIQESLNKKRKEAEQQLANEKEKRIKNAQKYWNETKENHFHEDHTTYLKLKQVKSFGLRFGLDFQGNAVLVIPIRNINDEIQAVEFIFKDGVKRIHGVKQGNFQLIGQVSEKSKIIVVEGYATGASAHEANNDPVVVAFDCGNLDPVIANLKTKYPNNQIIIAADDDRGTKNNPGRTKAEESVKKHDCLMILPYFPDDFSLPNGKIPTDFNDLHVHFGLDEVKRQLTENKNMFGREFLFGQKDKSTCDWSEPKPIKASLYSVPPFDSEILLPEVLRNWVVDEANRMPCPPEFIAAAVIVSLGAVIGARCAVKPKSNDSWLIVPNLWGGIVGLPSTKKSPAINAALKPLNRLILLAEQEQRLAIDEYVATKTVFEARKEAIELRIKTEAKKSKNCDLDSIVKELLTHQQEAPKKPILRRFKSNDTTIEKLGELLKDNPAGLLILRDELVGLIASWDKAGHEGDRAFYLEAWNGNSSFDTDRIGRGHVLIPNLCTSIFGGIQPDKLTSYLEQSANALANDGMVQRFQMLIYPDHRAWEWCDFIPDKDACDKAYAVFEAIGNTDLIAWGASPSDDYVKFPSFNFDMEAQQIFIEWSTELNRERLPNEDNPLISQHLAKYEKLFSALALIFHLVDCATSRSNGSIKVQSARRAAAWCEYLEAHARRCYGLLADDGLRSAQALADKLCQGKLSTGFTSRDVRRNQWRYLTTEDAVQAALDWLEDEGWLRANEVGGTGPGTGRRTYRYDINPKLKKMDKSKNDNDELV